MRWKVSRTLTIIFDVYHRAPVLPVISLSFAFGDAASKSVDRNKQLEAVSL